LRLRAAASDVADFTSGTFQPVIGDDVASGEVRRVLLCSGRVYYDLASQREKNEDTTTAIVRLEQLYPLAEDDVRAELERFPNAVLVLVQDEPANQCPWTFVSDHLSPAVLGNRQLRLVSRPAAASPATGLMKLHQLEQQELVTAAFA